MLLQKADCAIGVFPGRRVHLESVTGRDALLARSLSQADVSRIAVMGALTLYLDFINIFIEILKLYGKINSKD